MYVLLITSPKHLTLRQQNQMLINPNKISILILSYIPVSIQPPDINNLWKIMNSWNDFVPKHHCFIFHNHSPLF